MDRLWPSVVVAIVLVASGCSGTTLEAVASRDVVIYALPDRSAAEGNRQIGVLPAGTAARVEGQVLGKDYAAYKVEVAESNGHERISGYVLLGDAGLDIREKN